MNTAIVYDGGIRDNGTPFYARVALANILQEDPDWYTEAGVVPTGHPFYIHVDDGRDDLDVSSIPHPWGFWMVDSHLGPDIRIHKARQADLVWCAQKPFVEVLAKEGIKAEWLPLACEPELHIHPQKIAQREMVAAVPKEWQSYYQNTLCVPSPVVVDRDLVFVGHLQDPAMSDRVEFLDAVFKTVADPWFEYGIFHQDMARVYARGRIGLNHAVRDDLNMRFFELASIGVPQLADRRMAGWRDLGFEEWVHFLPYSSIEEACRVIRQELTGAHASMVASARHLVQTNHTYTHRVRRMLDGAKDRGYL